MSTKTLKTLYSFLKENDTKTSSGTTVKSYSHDNGDDVVLCMVHGYPQSSYMWRHVIPDLSKKASIFVPELPGYGISSMPPSPDKRVVGGILMEALQSVFGKDRPVIWCSHDRGARVGHRLLANADSAWNIKAAIFMDIVPTSEQWKVCSNPAACVGYFHWPFLATPTAPEMIQAMGGDKFCRMIMERGKIGSEAAIASMQADDAWDVYCKQFSGTECIQGSCDDYAEGSVPECQKQEEDQKAGRKVSVPLMVLYSAASLGKMHGDAEAKWRDWVSGDLKCIAIGDGHGHYLPESCPDIVTKHVIEWIDKVKV